MLEEVIKKDAAKGNILSLFKQNFIEFGQKVKNTGEWIKNLELWKKAGEVIKVVKPTDLELGVKKPPREE